jgi:LysM repeat protein
MRSFDDDDFLAARWTGRGTGPTRSGLTWRGRLGLGVAAFALLVPVSFALRNDSSLEPVGSGRSATAVVPPLVRSSSTSTVPPLDDVTPVAQAPCPELFEVRPGDSWFGLAAATGVSVDRLLASNGASLDTVLLPGEALCLPEGATPPPSTTIAATATQAPCPQRFEVRPGDSWFGLAAATGVSVDRLLALNGARLTTMLVPGRSLCFPANARRPAPSTTTPTPTTVARSGAAAATPTMPPAVPPRSTTDDVLRTIREVWPPVLHNEAILVAQRESRLVSNVRNACCWGLFQIHFEAHRRWLATQGVTQPVQLLDAATNIRVAWALYQRSGGWGPWRL